MINVEISNGSADDFARKTITLRASYEDKSLAWNIPERIFAQSVAGPLIYDEFLAEFREQLVLSESRNS